MTCSSLLCGPQRQLLRAARPLQLQVQRRTWLGPIVNSSLYHRKHTVSDLRAASTWSNTCTFLVYADALWQARHYEQSWLSKTSWISHCFFNCHRHTPENIYVNNDIVCNFIQHAVLVSLRAERNYVASSYTGTICLPQSWVCKEVKEIQRPQSVHAARAYEGVINHEIIRNAWRRWL